MFIDDLNAGGWWPLQHQESDYDPVMRAARYAARIERRDEFDRYVVAAGTAGDLLGGHLWGAAKARRPRTTTAPDLTSAGALSGAIPVSTGRTVVAGDVQTAARSAPGWAFAWPAQTAEKTQFWSAFGEQGHVAELHPVHDERWAHDDRFVRLRGSVHDLWPKLPKRWPGIVLAATAETSQENLFVPSGGPLIAANVAGDPECSTPVYDLTADSEPDRKRRAPLHSALRVVLVGGEGLALQFTESGRDQLDGYGLIYGDLEENVVGVAPPPEPPKAPPRTATGGARFQIGAVTWFGGKPGTQEREGSGARPGDAPGTQGRPSNGANEAPPGKGAAYLAFVRKGGPVSLGGRKDKHRLAATGDGEPVNSAHLATNALWYGHGGDAPLQFQETRYVEPRAGPLFARVHLRYHAVAAGHDWRTELKDGLWRWLAETTTAVPPRRPDDPPPRRPDDPPPRPPDPPRPPLPPSKTGAPPRQPTGSGDWARTPKLAVPAGTPPAQAPPPSTPQVPGPYRHTPRPDPAPQRPGGVDPPPAKPTKPPPPLRTPSGRLFRPAGERRHHPLNPYDPGRLELGLPTNRDRRPDGPAPPGTPEAPTPPRRRLFRPAGERRHHPLQPYDPGRITLGLPDDDERRPRRADRAPLGLSFRASEDAVARPRAPHDEPAPIALATLEHVFPAVGFRATPRHAPDLARAEAPSAAQLAALDRAAPVVARLEGYAAFPTGGSSGRPVTKVGRAGRPEAQGGLVLAPPGHDVAATVAGRVVASGSPTPYLTFHKAAAAWGVPDTTTGKIKSGFESTADSSGNLTFGGVNSDGAAVDTLAFRVRGVYKNVGELGRQQYGPEAGDRWVSDLTLTPDLTFYPLNAAGGQPTDRALRVVGDVIASRNVRGVDANFTGKLTVGGVIDPTGLILTAQAARPAPVTAATGLWQNNAAPNHLFFWNGTADFDLCHPAGGGVAAPVDPAAQGFRLGLVPGDPLADEVSGGTTLYLTPYRGNLIALYDGVAWQARSSAEVSLALGALAGDTNYDVYAYWTGAAVALETVAWAGPTVSPIRAWLNGVLTKATNATRRLVGAIRTTAAGGAVHDRAGDRYLSNLDNRVPRRDKVAANSFSTNSINFVTTGMVLRGLEVLDAMAVWDVTAGMEGTSNPPVQEAFEVVIGLDGLVDALGEGIGQWVAVPAGPGEKYSALSRRMVLTQTPGYHYVEAAVRVDNGNNVDFASTEASRMIMLSWR